MKKIEAIIRREKFALVDAALKKAGVGGLTMEEVRGRGRTRLLTTVYVKGIWTQEEEYIRHVKLEIIVKDEDAKKVVEEIMSAASTESPGDGKVFVTSVDEFLDIGSKQSGNRAVEMGGMPPVMVTA
jgi:nitrogen regulatory protein P-II 1